MDPIRARSIGSVLLRAVLIAAIGLTAFVAYGLVDNAWYRVLAVRGNSMQPTIAAGDLIVITRPPDQVEVGQVLTLQIDGAVVTHRVVEVGSGGTFVTQGDANETRDDWSANDVHIVGEYRFRLPLLGSVIEPIVSGAWIGAERPTTVSVQSGQWGSATVESVDTRTGRISWASSPTPEPLLAASASSAPSAAATSSPAPSSGAPAQLPSPSPFPSPSPSPSPEPTDAARAQPTPSPPPASPSP